MSPFFLRCSGVCSVFFSVLVACISILDLWGVGFQLFEPPPEKDTQDLRCSRQSFMARPATPKRSASSDNTSARGAFFQPSSVLAVINKVATSRLPRDANHLSSTAARSATPMARLAARRGFRARSKADMVQRRAGVGDAHTTAVGPICTHVNTPQITCLQRSVPMLSPRTSWLRPRLAHTIATGTTLPRTLARPPPFSQTHSPEHPPSFLSDPHFHSQTHSPEDLTPV